MSNNKLVYESDNLKLYSKAKKIAMLQTDIDVFLDANNNMIGKIVTVLQFINYETGETTYEVPYPTVRQYSERSKTTYLTWVWNGETYELK